VLQVTVCLYLLRRVHLHSPTCNHQNNSMKVNENPADILCFRVAMWWMPHYIRNWRKSLETQPFCCLHSLALVVLWLETLEGARDGEWKLTCFSHVIPTKKKHEIGIDQFRYIKLQSKTIDISTKHRGIITESEVFYFRQNLSISKLVYLQGTFFSNSFIIHQVKTVKED